MLMSAAHVRSFVQCMYGDPNISQLIFGGDFPLTVTVGTEFNEPTTKGLCFPLNMWNAFCQCCELGKAHSVITSKTENSVLGGKGVVFLIFGFSSPWSLEI